VGNKGEYTVLELDGSRLTAITAAVQSSKIEVKRWLSAQRPETVPVDNVEAVGGWIGQELRKAGLPRARVVLAVSRGDIVLKQLSIPAAGAITEAELANLVRLQMSRQLTMSMEGTAIDYAVVGEETVGASRAKSVLVGAMPADRVKWCKSVINAARLKLSRIGLRSFGAAAVLSELSQRRTGPLLGIAIGASSTEFMVVQDGHMVFARAADMPRPAQRDEIEAFAERVSVEARRTWASFRSSRPGAGEVDCVAVIGEGELARYVAERSAAGLGCVGETVTVPPNVVLPERMPEGERAIAGPLAGLLLEQLIKRPTLDFANTRRVPDQGARVRILAMCAVLALIVFGGFGFVAAKLELDDLRGERDVLAQQQADLRKQADASLAVQARASHLEQWSNLRPDWLKHFAETALQVPAEEVILDEFVASIRARISFAPKKGAMFPDGEWVSSPAVVVKLAGNHRPGDGVARFRQMLLERGVYQVNSSGPDMPERFGLELTSTRLDPHPAVPKDPAGPTTSLQEAKP
jgi:hypothetical protein